MRNWTLFSVRQCGSWSVCSLLVPAAISHSHLCTRNGHTAPSCIYIYIHLYATNIAPLHSTNVGQNSTPAPQTCGTFFSKLTAATTSVYLRSRSNCIICLQYVFAFEPTVRHCVRIPHGDTQLHFNNAFDYVSAKHVNANFYFRRDERTLVHQICKCITNIELGLASCLL